MGNQKNTSVKYNVELDSETITANSPEELIGRMKLIQAKHPDAKFSIGAVVTWWTVNNNSVKSSMTKVFEIKWPIALQEQRQGRLKRLWSAFQARRRHALSITRPEPLSVIQSILQNYTRNLLDSGIVPLFDDFHNRVLQYSPRRKETMIIPLRGEKYGWVVKVLQKDSAGAGLSATWLLRLGEYEAVLSLYRLSRE